MSSTPLPPEPPSQGVSSESGQTPASRSLLPTSDPSASKRLCFYKSGDLQFSGHRMVLNARTFKTYDALLDALSKKVPLPFGVRTITTPRGTRPIRGLEDFHDGGSYVCSDQRRVKPLDLDAVNRRQVPWNTTRPVTRPVSGGRRWRGGSGRGNEARPARITDRVAVRTPKRLVVIKNRDPAVKRTVVLQKRTAPTFDALLDYLSQTMQFRVLKLYSADGRRVDGLAALILCSGVIVAAGNEPFRLANNQSDLQRTGQTLQSVYSDAAEPARLQPLAQKHRPYSGGRASRNFSLSSERYIVNQINSSRNSQHRSGSFEAEVTPRHRRADRENCERLRVEDRHQSSMVPQDDDIEKSFRVNQDGSMTVEMRVRLNIKEEELLHWTTTLSRSSLAERPPAYASRPRAGGDSPDSNNAMAEDVFSEEESKEENHHTHAGKGVGDERGCEKPKSALKRTPTPGPRHFRKTASVESVKTVTESGVRESSLGQYSYMERTADSETAEGYCVVRQSSDRPIPKPRKTASAGARNKKSNSSPRSPGEAEVLQIQNNGIEVTETVMHIYERQGCYDNYFANEEYSSDGVPKHNYVTAQSRASVDSGPYSSSNDCDVDFTGQSPAAESVKRWKEEILSLSSEPVSATCKSSNNLSSSVDHKARTAANPEARSPPKQTASAKKDKAAAGQKQKKTAAKPNGKQKSMPSTSGSDKKQEDSSRSTKRSSGDKPGSVTLGKKNGSASESDKNFRKSKGAEKPLTRKRVSRDDATSGVKQALSLNIENTKGSSSRKQLNTNPRAAKDNGQYRNNVNTPETRTARPPIKKNIQSILQPNRSSLPAKKVVARHKSMNDYRTSSPTQTLKLNESISMPALNPTPSDVHQYVENWLQHSVPYIKETAPEESPKTKVVFQIGADSESEAEGDCQVRTGEHCLSLGDDGMKSMSCLLIPGRHGEPASEGQRLCASMPSIRVGSAEVIGPFGSESPSYTSGLLSANTKITPILRQLCSSIEFIRRVAEPKQLPDIKKSSSVSNFSSQMATVFGSTSKAFLSFLSVTSLRETLMGSTAVEDSPQEDSPQEDSKSAPEAMLVMESLQKISTIEDEEELRASLTDLQNRTSSQLRERWRDFQVLRERLESEPLSPKSEHEFALDVLSEGGDVFDDQRLRIDELMDELNISRDMREEISSTLQQAKSFYPEIEESITYMERERHHTDSEDELELFAKEHNITEQSESDPGEEDNKNNLLAAGEIYDSEHKPDESQGMDSDVEEPEAEGTEPGSTLENISELGTEGDVCGSTRTMSGEGEMGEELEDGEVGAEGVGDECKGVEEAEDADQEEVNDGEEGDETGEENRRDSMEERGEKSEEDGEEEGADARREKEKEEVEVREEEGEGEEEEEVEGGEEGVMYEQEGEEVSAPEEELQEGEEEKEGNGEKDEVEGEEEEYDEVDEVEGEGGEEEEGLGEAEIGEEQDMGEYRQGDEEEAIKEKEEEEGLEEVDVEEAQHEVEEEEEVEQDNDLDEGCERTSEGDEEEEGLNEPADADSIADGNAGGAILEGSYDEDRASSEGAGAQGTEKEVQSSYNSSCELKFDEDKGHGTDTTNEHKTEDGVEEQEEESSSRLPHPVEISQDLLDFVNSALQSSSLIFTYDARGNVRIEPDSALFGQTRRMVIPKTREDRVYGLKRLPSPNTSDLSDYRPDTSESGGYKSQESTDVATESGEERQSPGHRHGCVTDIPTRRTHREHSSSKQSSGSKSDMLQSPTLKSEGSRPSYDSGMKVSTSVASSLKADTEPVQCTPLASEADSSDGVLIDQGRWLLKENHLIRRSPPDDVGMYGNGDMTSVDTGNSSDEGPARRGARQDPLAAISSSELEEMAKPQTPKCAYFNMPHGSDSDPFRDDASVKSRNRDGTGSQGNGLRASPTIDTSRTWTKKNGSFSSFASVEFKLADSRVHPEGGGSTVEPRSSNVAGRVLHAGDALERQYDRCDRFCHVL